MWGLPVNWIEIIISIFVMIFDDIAKNVCIITAELYSAYNVIAIIPQSVIAVFLLLCKYLLDAALQILQLMYIDVSTLYQNGS